MVMWVLIALLVVMLFVFVSKSRRGVRIFIFIFFIMAGASLVVYNSIKGNALNNLEFLSSFFSKSKIELLNSEIFASTNEEENPERLWKSFNPDMADIRKGSSSFIIIPKSESIWQRRSAGPMIYKSTGGDFLFSSLVRTRKLSDTIQFPDKGLQFGGIILRNPSSAFAENYIMIAVGYKEKELKLEVKSTTNGASTESSFVWPSGDAELMIQSETGVYGLYARPYGTMGEWTKIQTYYRPDLPGDLQAGLVAYSSGFEGNKQDIIAYFDDVKIRKQDEE